MRKEVQRWKKMSAGLTSNDWKDYHELLVKANEEQLTVMLTEIYQEVHKRGD